MLELAQSAQRRSDYPFQKIANETVIVDPKARVMHQLNELGSRIWELLERKMTLQELVDAISEEYREETDTIRADAIKFLEDMADKGLIRIE
ncbi:MAG: PqqD family protein [Planctomycetota bacterium]